MPLDNHEIAILRRRLQNIESGVAANRNLEESPCPLLLMRITNIVEYEHDLLEHDGSVDRLVSFVSSLTGRERSFALQLMFRAAHAAFLRADICLDDPAENPLPGANEGGVGDA